MKHFLSSKVIAKVKFCGLMNQQTEILIARPYKYTHSPSVGLGRGTREWERGRAFKYKTMI